MTRRRLSEREVVAIVARQLIIHKRSIVDIGGTWHPLIWCPICKEPIWPEQIPDIERDHDDAIGFGPGRDTLENCRYVHGHCHKRKTASDKARMAKADRQAGRTGQKARRDRRKAKEKAAAEYDKIHDEQFKQRRLIPSGPMPGTKASRWRKRMDGTTERREP